MDSDPTPPPEPATGPLPSMIVDLLVEAERLARQHAAEVGRGPEGLAYNALATTIFAARATAGALVVGARPVVI